VPVVFSQLKSISLLSFQDPALDLGIPSRLFVANAVVVMRDAPQCPLSRGFGPHCLVVKVHDDVQRLSAGKTLEFLRRHMQLVVDRLRYCRRAQEGEHHKYADTANESDPPCGEVHYRLTTDQFSRGTVLM